MGGAGSRRGGKKSLRRRNDEKLSNKSAVDKT